MIVALQITLMDTCSLMHSANQIMIVPIKILFSQCEANAEEGLQVRQQVQEDGREGRRWRKGQLWREPQDCQKGRARGYNS